MSYVFQSPAAGAGAPGFAQRFTMGLGSALRTTARQLAAGWRRAAARREFNRVDDNTLRDLGISRGEFDSYWAETEGLAEPTRLRVTRHLRGSQP